MLWAWASRCSALRSSPPGCPAAPAGSHGSICPRSAPAGRLRCLPTSCCSPAWPRRSAGRRCTTGCPTPTPRPRRPRRPCCPPRCSRPCCSSPRPPDPRAAPPAVPGLGRPAPALGTAIGVSLGALSGLPPSPLFISEALILAGGFGSGRSWAAAAAAVLLALGFLGLAHAAIETVTGKAHGRDGAQLPGLRPVAALAGVSVVILLGLAAAAPWLAGTGVVAALERGLPRPPPPPPGTAPPSQPPSPAGGRHAGSSP